MGLRLGERLLMLRTKLGLSQRELAKMAGVAVGMISMIELDRTNPSVGTLKKILDSMNVSMAEFFTFEMSEARKVVYRSDELVEMGGKGLTYRQVGTNLQGMSLQMIRLRLDPGADTGKSMVTHEAEEGGIVIEGKLELMVDGRTYLLNAGDAYNFDSRLPHRFRNTSKEVCEIICACTPPSI